MSLPTWERGLKQAENQTLKFAASVAPYVGAWIETIAETIKRSPYNVAPYVGAWIETNDSKRLISLRRVAPYVGAWIETQGAVAIAELGAASLPTWERGLKLVP